MLDTYLAIIWTCNLVLFPTLMAFMITFAAYNKYNRILNASFWASSIIMHIAMFVVDDLLLSIIAILSIGFSVMCMQHAIIDPISKKHITRQIDIAVLQFAVMAMLTTFVFQFQKG